MIERLLDKLDLYEPLTDAEREAIASIVQPPTTYAGQEEIIPQFAEPRESTLLLSGMVGRVVTLRSGAQQITAVHFPGDFVDLHSLLIRALDHSVVALTRSVVTTFPHMALRRIVDLHPRLGRALWFLTLVDAATHRQWLTLLGRRDAVSRTAHLLCEFYLRLADVGLAADRRMELPFTQGELANMLGISAVHANRVLQILRSRRLIRWSAGLVEILDWDQLTELAEFDPTYLQLNGRVRSNMR